MKIFIYHTMVNTEEKETVLLYNSVWCCSSRCRCSFSFNAHLYTVVFFFLLRMHVFMCHRL